MNITRDELLNAIAAAMKSAAPEDARTAKELQEATGLHANKVSEALRSYHKAGRLRTHRVQREAIDGTLRWITAYTIAPA